MKALVAGATGLIGTALCARLNQEGHEIYRIVRPGRSHPWAGSREIVLDVARALDPADWQPHLLGMDAVVNCVGVLQDGPHDDPDAVHRSAPEALFRACAQTGVTKVIHFSAIGVDRLQPSPFSTSKLAGDEVLTTLDLDWIILRPSVVLGRPVYGASALFRGLAALPLLPLMPNTGRLQVVQLEDVVATVIFFLRPDSPSRLALELAGPETLSMSDVIGQYRRWFGWRKAREFTIPDWAASLLYGAGDLAGMLGWRPAMRTNAAKEITRGATGDPQPWIRTTGLRPSSLSNALATNPATVQERWFARLYFIKPAIFVVLPFFWIMTGIISLTSGWRSGVELLITTAVSALAQPAVVAGALADIAVGTLIAWRPTASLGLWGAIGISFFYAVCGTILRPDLWNEPLGPLMKILPILVMHFVALAVLEER
ncbi:SDR family oxidoreductase [Mesorhizobium sp. CO1-1-8]|uniref:SDR family oxidoreductase n=1 Tax=Mesorhizobium sp. CO1-1-8 TaxID=2876631 RepID=UPI001CD0E8F6|nr:SDR family oxidoreductase [Mesorhizobium sp. CO1-1-8]MBZ9777128.1 SDR family oxidoreductase [Mesorhizobium sp. CO1-1-8]